MENIQNRTENRHRLRIIALCFFIAFCGSVMGSALTLLYMHHRDLPFGKGVPRDPRRRNQKMISRMKKILALSDEQEGKIREIMKWEEECKNKMKRFKGHFRRKPGHYPGKHRFTKPMPKQPHS